jgi:hypothetical protein
VVKVRKRVCDGERFGSDPLLLGVEHSLCFRESFRFLGMLFRTRRDRSVRQSRCKRVLRARLRLRRHRFGFRRETLFSRSNFTIVSGASVCGSRSLIREKSFCSFHGSRFISDTEACGCRRCSVLRRPCNLALYCGSLRRDLDSTFPEVSVHVQRRSRGG